MMLITLSLSLILAQAGVDGGMGLKELRAQLSRPDISSLSGFEGAKRLMSLSSEPADLKLALSSIERADLKEVSQSDYFFAVHELAVKGLDTSEAAFRILALPDFKVEVPQHHITLRQNFCLFYMLMPTDETFYLEKLEDRLANEKNIVAQKSLLMMLYYSVLPEADAVIQEFIDDEKRPYGAQEYASGLLRKSKAAADTLIPSFSIVSYKSVKAERRKVSSRVSDAAIKEINQLTAKLIRKKPKSYEKSK
ncbi:MAG: hypothetical protein WC889_16780 [Myxococcota bacterium]|jgi:hypothetical protein